MRHVLDRLPSGRTLPPGVWAARHRFLVTVVLLHVPALYVFGLARGFAPFHPAVDVIPIAVLGLVAAWSRPSRGQRAICVALGLLTSSAMLVHLWDGTIEAHFHFFVAVTMLALYEEWFPYLIAIAYVVLHHGIVGVLDPNSVFAHDVNEKHPWRWAAIHGGFISALAATNIISWRLNENVRGQMRTQEARFRSAFYDAPTGMALVTADGRIESANAAFCARTGYADDVLTTMRLRDLLHESEQETVQQWPVVGPAAEERRFVRADGTVGWAIFQHSEIPLEDSLATTVTHMLDISVRKDAERQLDHQAHHDPLTGLPNRKLFVQRLDAALRDPQPGRTTAVLFVDLDNFKLVNDSLGHVAGDRLLVTVAERMRRVLRPDDLVARFGGDEFAVLVSGVATDADAHRPADRLLSALRAPVVLDGEQRFITASVGICVADTDSGPDAQALLRDADAAMYRAKERGKARFEVFDAGLRDQVVERVAFESALRGAAERGELRLDYQPFIDLAATRVTGVEALLRWDHPELGTVPPLRFIPVAEQSGLITEIGAWVLRTACAQAAEWPDSIEIAVNVSPRQLASATFVTEVADALTDAGLPPERLCLEVTESAVVADIESATLALNALRDLGVRLAVDDFGVGYASLSQLKALPPVDVLKIDRSFVNGILADAEDRAIVEAVLNLAASLGLKTVAEGVETEEQADMLRQLECTIAQGFHFARPTSPAGIAELLRREAAGELV